MTPPAAVRRPARSHGFSLVELALVLMIVGLIIGALTPLLTTQTVNARVTATRAKQDAIRTALTTYLARNGHLPCPADPMITPTGANAALYGREMRIVPAGVTACTATAGLNVAVGIVPWVDLGLPDDAATDGFQRRFTYAVTDTAALLNPDPTQAAFMRGALWVFRAAPPNPAAAALGTGAVTTLPVAVVLLSHGIDGLGAWMPRTGKQMTLPPPAELDQRENANADPYFVQADYSQAGANPFDDLVTWLGTDDLLAPLAKDGAIPSAAAQTMQQMARVEDAINAYVAANGGNLPLDLALLPGGAPRNGWGGVFTITQVQPGSLCPNPNPAIQGNTAYVLNSPAVLAPSGVAFAPAVSQTVLVSQVVNALSRTYGC